MVNCIVAGRANGDPMLLVVGANNVPLLNVVDMNPRASSVAVEHFGDGVGGRGSIEDLRAARPHYEERRPGLGARFADDHSALRSWPSSR